jgi:murein DD-endopeptidase MepM/ murein hydrolase activator NlpD
MKIHLTILSFSALILACVNPQNRNNEIATYENDERITQINDYLDTLITDGFDFPVGNTDGKGKYTSLTTGKVYDSWYIATKFAENYSLGIHTGIDLNGTGGGDTDLGQPVYSIGKGMVIEANDFGAPWGNVVIVKHKYLENGHIQYCFSLYAHLHKITIQKGKVIQRRGQIGEIGKGGDSYPAHLHLEIRKEIMKDFEATYWPSSNGKNVDWINEHYENPETFINKHRATTCPYLEKKILIALKNAYQLYYYENGILKNNYEIALSQSPVGHKEKQGDLKLPEGEYYLCGKEKGPFYGNYSEFLGTRLIRISYPNIFDAENGYNKGLISKKEKEQIILANKNKTMPPKNTKLGGGIAIHGWYGDWIADGNQNLTWGCISMHNKDIEKFYDLITLKTKILISK